MFEKKIIEKKLDFWLVKIFDNKKQIIQPQRRRYWPTSTSTSTSTSTKYWPRSIYKSDELGVGQPQDVVRIRRESHFTHSQATIVHKNQQAFN